MDREKLIGFIRANDTIYSEFDFLEYTIEQLVIIKVEIELRIERKKNNKRNTN